MANTVRVFDFDINIHGARVVVRQGPLCPGCLSDGEVDGQIRLLKADLDAVAQRMKVAIRKQASQPLGIWLMPRGPRGEKRSADVNARAVMIAKIATGEVEDKLTDDGKNAAAVALGRMGGKARAVAISARRRREIARKAAQARWS